MIRAHITQKFWADTTAVYIVEHSDHRYRLLQMDDGVVSWTEWTDDAVTRDDKPSILLPHDSGRALLQALVEHYQGAEDTRALRRDYDAERKRVDHHVEVIADIARSLAIRSTH